ncbi:hypothetical protein [Pseudonocardia phyllosphaerae]
MTRSSGSSSASRAQSSAFDSSAWTRVWLVWASQVVRAWSTC